MFKRFLRLLSLVAVIIGGGYGVYYYEAANAPIQELKAENKRLLEQKQMLEAFLARLKAERRVADVLVTDQTTKNGKIDTTTLMFVEYDRDNKPLPKYTKFFTIKGSRAHIEALVIKFDPQFVQEGDKLRGQSIVLFYRLYGDYQAPSDGFPIDTPGQAPGIYRPDPSASPEAREFEAALWNDFWKLSDDPVERAKRGVRIAQGEGPWREFKPDQVYTLTLDANGGLNITNRPMEGLYKTFIDDLRNQRASARPG
jgi:hypothetical protein